MDKIIEPDVWRISRRFLIYYFPIFLCYILFSIILTVTIIKKTVNLPGFVIIMNNVLSVLIMYLFIILPVILFKPKKPSTRRIVMLFFTLLFTAIIMYIEKSLFHMYDFLETTSISTSQIIFADGYSIFSLGIFICFFYYVEEKQFITENRIISERNKKLKNEKMKTETHLKLLQAQIEPHFLFNTLASIFSLTDTDLQKAKKMHNNFKQYLKTTLNKTRSNITTIGQEIDLIKAYLDIFKVRMGKRLQYSVKVDDEVNDFPFPSMLIQPIVENSIKHGLEPKIDGGEVIIQIKRIEGDKVRWIIADTGFGMSDMSHLGTGLSNVMERIEMLYGKEGNLDIKENQPSGVKVILEVPCV